MEGQDRQLPDAVLADKFLDDRRDAAFRWGTRCLRGGGWNYNPCVLDRTGWEDFYQSLPLDYDVKNDPVYDLSRSSYHRLGDLGFSWPEPTTREALRTGFCGPDKNKLTHPASSNRGNVQMQPEPAFRTHLTDRTSLHHLRADPLEGVLPFGLGKDDMKNAKSVMHRDFKWRKKCCTRHIPKENIIPCLDSRVHRFIKTDLNKDANVALVDRIQTFQDENFSDEFKSHELLKLKKAYNWPINPITNTPLGGRLYYYHEEGDNVKKSSECVDVCENLEKQIWPFGRKDRIQEKPNPKVIPDCRCYLLGNGQKRGTVSDDAINWNYNASCLDPYMDPRCDQTENYCEEVPYRICDDTPANCCFTTVQTKGPPQDNSKICPPKPPCPRLP